MYAEYEAWQQPQPKRPKKRPAQNGVIWFIHATPPTIDFQFVDDNQQPAHFTTAKMA